MWEETSLIPIVEMDLNPIFTYPAGTAPAAVDVRIKVR